VHYLGRRLSTNKYDGYLAEVNFIDGQALTPSSFGEFGDYGEFKPIEYTGTYGTNGFHLDFKTSGTLGNDANGSNNWTTNNLSATDQMIDTPTNNFATLNPLFTNGGVTQSMSEGNLKFLGDGNYATAAGTIGLRTGKWYWETVDTVSAYQVHGIVRGTSAGGNTYVSYDPSNNVFGFGYRIDGGIRGSAGTGSTTGAVLSSTGTTYTVGDVIGFASDIQNGTLAFYKNNVLVYTITGINDDDWIPALSRYSGGKSVVNFGQDSSFAGNKTAQGNQDGNAIGDFYYTPPTGFLALCTKNLPAPTVIPSEHFNTVLYTGNGSTQSITGVGFQPDLVWTKGRSAADNNSLFDIVRGVTKELNSNGTGAEGTASGVASFDTDGFTLGSNVGINGSSKTYVAWNWKAGGTAVSNTSGSITSSVSANTDAGFSIVSYTGTGVNATVGHGLSKAPNLTIIKPRSFADNWIVTYDSVDGSDDQAYLNLTNAGNSPSASFVVAQNATTLGLTSWNNVNDASDTYIAYCFHSVDGHSKVSSYTGNGSADGPFVHTGFRPAWVLQKNTSGFGWQIWDSTRDPHNVATRELFANSSSTEYSDATYTSIDFLSNGFKLRTNNTSENSGENIYLAFAESPFKHSNAR
jgi:hypothetical protein